MQLSKRLLMVTNLVTKGSVVADVGCDHAYISIHLVTHGIAPNTFALDINKGPLEKAKANIASYGLSDKITTRLSDGLRNLPPEIVDTIVIAGMGGPLGVKILMEGRVSVEKATELVLQLQSELDKVRLYLHTIGFAIAEESMCKEDGKYYTAIRAVRSEQTSEQSNDCLLPVYLKFGKYLLQTKNPVLKEYLIKEYNKAIDIKSNLELQETENARLRLSSLMEEIADLKEALSFFI